MAVRADGGPAQRKPPVTPTPAMKAPSPRPQSAIKPVAVKSAPRPSGGTVRSVARPAKVGKGPVPQGKSAYANRQGALSGGSVIREPMRPPKPKGAVPKLPNLGRPLQKR